MSNDIEQRLSILEQELAKAKSQIRRRRFRAVRSHWVRLAGAAVATGIILGGLLVFLHWHTRDPVPESIRSAVSFPVYYPDPRLMPIDFSTVSNSFTTTANHSVVIYEVRGKTRQLINVSVEQKPSASVLAKLSATVLPSHVKLTTEAGHIQAGTGNHELVGSLVTNQNSWVLVTAPLSLTVPVLTQFMKSLQSP